MVICISIPLIILLIIQMEDSRREKEFIKEKEEKQRKMEAELEELKSNNEKHKTN